MDNKTDKDLLLKGLKTMIFAVLALFTGPILLSFAFRYPEKNLYIPLLISGCLVCAFAIFLIFNGIKIIMSSIFKK